MRTTQIRKPGRTTWQAAFSLVEVLVGMAIAGVMLGSLYAGFTFGFAITQVTRENLRATQVMVEKMETIRLYRWDQIKEPGFIPKTFKAPYYAVGTNDSSGIVYDGTITFSTPDIGTSYVDDLTQVQIDLSWESGGITRNRSMTTLVSRDGMQQYIY